MKFIMGQKIEMTQTYNDKGEVVPITLVKMGPCVVTQVKTTKTDGYNAIQVGFGTKKHPSAAQRGHLKGLLADEKKTFRFVKEFRLETTDGIERGDSLDMGSFELGEKLVVTGTSKGKGFAGVVKRHHFRGHPTSHGHKDQERMPGSIGAGGIQRVFKGQRMGGHMGDEQVTLKNLPIIQIDAEKGVIAVKGALPGARNGLVILVTDGEMKFKKANEVEVKEAAPVAVEEQSAPAVAEVEEATTSVVEEAPVEQVATEEVSATAAEEVAVAPETEAETVVEAPEESEPTA